MTISAVDMAQKGVKLAVSTAEWFADMRVEKTPLFGKLSLSPMMLSGATAGLLARQPGGAGARTGLSLLAMLMDRAEDVHEVRRSGVLRSRFCNTQTLAYFKAMGQHLRPGFNYFSTLDDIQDYMRWRPVRIAVHKFLYSNYRAVAAVLSIAGVLVGIFKALYSLKRT
ncbi:hypothetical protein ACP4OV_018575 [Aristida adscensionis]